MSSEPKTLISVVDDDPSVRKSLGRLIASFGFDAETFASADEYIVAEQTRPPDCLVLDIHLGGMSGIELQERLQQSDRSVPIIFITAHSDGNYQELVLERGAVAFLTKPFDDDELMDAIERALERQHPSQP